MHRNNRTIIEGVTVYGIYNSLEPNEIRYVGQTEVPTAARLGQHITFFRTGRPNNEYSSKFKRWGQDVLAHNGDLAIVNLSKIKLMSEQDWVNDLLTHNHRLFNCTLTGVQAKILKAAWRDPSKRANMSAHHKKLHAQLRKTPVLNTAGIRWQRESWSVSDAVKGKISATLTGRVNGPHSIERKHNAAIAVRLWHRNLTPLSADAAWLNLLVDIMKRGSSVTPRGRKTLELLGSLIVVDMKQPVVTIVERKVGYRFMCAEAAMIINGDDKVSTLAPYSKIVSNFSDDGKRFFGAYGTKFRSQLDYVVAALKKDQNTRQAVFNIWRENPPITRDYPCTLSSHFMIRNGQLDTFVTMRSNDAWLGTCYDIFSASMWSAYVLLRLELPKIKLGNLYHVAASRHLYAENFEAVKECLNGMTIGFKYKPLQVKEFAKSDDLPKHLWSVARKETVCHKWLKELASK